MPYYVQKNGSTYRLTWRKGNEKPRNVSKESDEAIKAGFRPDMTLEQAQIRAKQLQAESWVELKAKQAARAKAVLERYAKLRSAFLTDEDAFQFEREYLGEYKIRRPHWNTMQRIIVDVGIHPSQWHKQKSKLYDQFRLKRCSANYAKKLLRYLNLWGYFLCEKQNKAWMKVDGLDGVWRNKLERARHPGGASLPLTPKMLEDAKKDIAEEHYNWLFISVWFGLRPEEVDQLRMKRGKLWDLKTDSELGFILEVYQTKLEKRGVKEEHCWKAIPTLFPEQLKAVEIIQSQNFKRPAGKGGKFMRHVFGNGYSLYAGRNNFSGMLRDRGRTQEERKHWMGHLSVSTTEQYDRKTQSRRVFVVRSDMKKAG